MSRAQQDFQGTSNNYSQADQTWQNQPPNKMPADWNAQNAQGAQAFQPTSMRPGDDLNSDQYGQTSNQYPPTGLSAAPGHGGQLGASGQQLRDPASTTGAGITNTPGGGPFGHGHQHQHQQFDHDVPGQHARTSGSGGAGAAVPPSSVQAQATKPSASERIIGNTEKLAGKVSGSAGLVQRGEARKTGGGLNQENF
ncbi:hypothetical protein DICSQDRAFT_158469 [Dichomitus squalens LYAD-421 SS1]|uniref:uncharacterized protein n=1 Tax=Dichomitus squalens (strain LYAD-421) TaxID=732165 RepID=UPI0004410BAD|nr:uncharacterized protein DICSQDRAFT_158469 [Dichomitus squalens LYAD-421 SS1]EJF66747.1 hypothetical protein DICSQDRAFT_158469 [Dichomitus squalens LYAD-421 SS1]